MRTKLTRLVCLITVIFVIIGVDTYVRFSSQDTSLSNAIKTGKLDIQTVDTSNHNLLLYVEEMYGIDGVYNNNKWHLGAQITNRTWTIKNTGGFPRLLMGFLLIYLMYQLLKAEPTVKNNA